MEEEEEKDVKGEVTKASSSQSHSPTEKLSPVTPEKLSAEGSARTVVPVQGHISEGELAAFMTGPEGQSVFQAWCSGGFTSEQIQRLYGQSVLEAFIANHLVIEAGKS